MGHTIIDSDDDSETIIDEHLPLDEVYSSLLSYLDKNHNIFCEETGLFYVSGEWISPDENDDLWEAEQVIFIPSQDAFEEELKNTGSFLLEEANIKVVEEKE